MDKKYYKLKDKKFIIFLFSLCFFVYLSTYPGRLNYSASITAILDEGNFTKSQTGIIGTAFFLAYGIGQFVSGFLGDKFSPKKLVFIGVFISSITNLCMATINNYIAMAIFWSINGLFQSFIWSPMIRFIVDFLDDNIKSKACIYLNLSVPIGTILAYVITASIIAIINWKVVFIVSGFILLVISILWVIGYGIIEKNAKNYGIEYDKEIINNNNKNSNDSNIFYVILSSGFIFLLFSLIVQGTLKDGVTNWVPVYINETYNLGSFISIVSTIIIPIFSIFGVYFASIINNKIKDEIKTSAIFFFICSICLTMLFIFSGKSVFISLLMLGISTTTMMAVNTMLIGLLPTDFYKINKVSSISGILNSFVYIGSAISTYSIGIMSENIGWKNTILIWIILAIISCIICLAVLKKWKNYRLKNL